MLVGASACNPNDSGSTFVTCDKLTPAPAVSPAAWKGSVFTIVMENHSRGEILGNKAAPFINQLAKQRRGRRRLSRLVRAPERAELPLDGRRARTSASSTTTIRSHAPDSTRRTSPISSSSRA